MKLDRAEFWNVAEILRDELGHISHHADIGVRLLHRLECRGIGESGQLVHRDAALLSRYAQRIRAALLGSAEHGRDRVPAVEESFQRCLAEILLADDRDPHVAASSHDYRQGSSLHAGPTLATAASAS